MKRRKAISKKNHAVVIRVVARLRHHLGALRPKLGEMSHVFAEVVKSLKSVVERIANLSC